VKCPQSLAHVIVHGTTHQAPHHVAQAGMTHHHVVLVRQAGTVALVHLLVQVLGIAVHLLVQVIRQVHQAGINYDVVR
jgi:hypothetical protein